MKPSLKTMKMDDAEAFYCVKRMHRLFPSAWHLINNTGLIAGVSGAPGCLS